MKRTLVILCTLLWALFVVLTFCAAAEEIREESDQTVGIAALMDAQAIPSVRSIRFTPDVPEAAVAERREYEQDLISSKGDVLNVRLRFVIRGTALGEGQWATVVEWLKQLVLTAVQRVQADPDSLANVISDGYQAGRLGATPGETGMPVWASEDLLLEEIVCTVPYYPDLSMDDNGDATRRLQQKLIQLGYLDGNADGYYGEMTRSAVMQLEDYVRRLEQDVIDASAPSMPMSAAAAPSAAGSGQILLVAGRSQAEADTAAESASGPGPQTEVDGIADGLLQAYLYSSSFRVCRADLSIGDEGDEVARVQRRLRRLGYTNDAPDGIYGGGTARAAGLFQYYNGLDPTGVSDRETQALLFSDRAKQPDNAVLTEGSSGEEVSKLQKRLRVLGFASIAVDGSYGSSTMEGVRVLQQYMKELQEEQSTDAVRRDLAIEVNGIADPMLLDDFYADTFPEIPAEMASGSSGRDVVRLQRRLRCLEYYQGEVDGQYGAGTEQAIAEFQRRNDLQETGSADRETLKTLFDENARKALKPYVLKVSVADQRVYAYAPDRNGEYTDLVRTMKCSTGRKSTPTPTGTFTDTCPGARWHYFKKFDCWAQYAFYIEGDIMFHSVLYNQKEGKVSRSSVNHLGSRASHGCVRLSVDDAKWIWNNCPANTTVIIH